MRWEGEGVLRGEPVAVWWEDGTFGADDIETDVRFNSDVTERIEVGRLDPTMLLRGYQPFGDLPADPDALRADPDLSVALGMTVLANGRVTFRSDDWPEPENQLSDGDIP